MIYQMFHQAKDGSTLDLKAQRECNKPEELRQFQEETAEKFPPPENAQWLVCNEKSEFFEYREDQLFLTEDGVCCNLTEDGRAQRIIIDAAPKENLSANLLLKRMLESYKQIYSGLARCCPHCEKEVDIKNLGYLTSKKELNPNPYTESKSVKEQDEMRKDKEMEEYKVEFRVKIPVEATEAEIDEWLSYELHETAGISLSNPLHRHDISAEYMSISKRKV